MGYNSIQQIRDLCGMSATLPTDAVIERWILLIDAMIEKYQPNPAADIAALIEGNRVAYLYYNMIHKNPKNLQAIQTFNIDPLSAAEKEMLMDTNVDSIAFNGKRRGEINGSRR